MNVPETIDPNHNLAPECCPATRSLVSHRRLLAFSAIGALAGGAWLGWDWLAAFGIAPILVAVAPCLIMCGVGLCVSKMFGGRRQ